MSEILHPAQTVNNKAETYHTELESIYKTSQLAREVLSKTVDEKQRDEYMSNLLINIQKNWGRMAIVEKDQSSEGTNVVFRKLDKKGNLAGDTGIRLSHGETVTLADDPEYEYAEDENGDIHVYLKVLYNGKIGWVAAEHLAATIIPVAEKVVDTWVVVEDKTVMVKKSKWAKPPITAEWSDKNNTTGIPPQWATWAPTDTQNWVKLPKWAEGAKKTTSSTTPKTPEGDPISDAPSPTGSDTWFIDKLKQGANTVSTGANILWNKYVTPTIEEIFKPAASKPQPTATPPKVEPDIKKPPLPTLPEENKPLDNIPTPPLPTPPWPQEAAPASAQPTPTTVESNAEEKNMAERHKNAIKITEQLFNNTIKPEDQSEVKQIWIWTEWLTNLEYAYRYGDDSLVDVQIKEKIAGFAKEYGNTLQNDIDLWIGTNKPFKEVTLQQFVDRDWEQAIDINENRLPDIDKVAEEIRSYIKFYIAVHPEEKNRKIGAFFEQSTKAQVAELTTTPTPLPPNEPAPISTATPPSTNSPATIVTTQPFTAPVEMKKTIEIKNKPDLSRLLNDPNITDPKDVQAIAKLYEQKKWELSLKLADGTIAHEYLAWIGFYVDNSINSATISSDEIVTKITINMDKTWIYIHTNKGSKEIIHLFE